MEWPSRPRMAAQSVAVPMLWRPAPQGLEDEEGAEVLHSQQAKLSRLRDTRWEERGLDELKLLLRRETILVRGLLRQEKTLKIVGNFIVWCDSAYCELKPNLDKNAWVWQAVDCSDREPQFGCG